MKPTTTFTISSISIFVSVGIVMPHASNAQVVSFTTTGLTASQSIAPTLDATFQATGLTGTSQISRTGLIAGSTGAPDVFYSTNANFADISILNNPDARYYQFSVTPSAGNVIFATDINWSSSGTNTSSNAYATQYSVDGFSAFRPLKEFVDNSGTGVQARNWDIVDLVTDETFSVRLFNYRTTSLSGGVSDGSGVFAITNPTILGSVVSTSNGAFNLSTVGATNFRTNNTMLLGGDIIGGRNVEKTGSGTLILTGTGTWTGRTQITTGTLQVGNGGATGTLPRGTIQLSPSTSFIVNRSGSVTFESFIQTNTSAGVSNVGSGITTFDGDISGVGSFTNSGSGTAILRGTNSFSANTYSGGTIISSGTVQVGSGGSFGTLGTGSVTNNGTLAFNRTGTLAVGNTVSGSGVTTFAGGGTFTVTGNNTYTGGTTINAGKVFANNATSSLGSSLVTVATGGTLGGTGKVAAPVSVLSGGTIAPGISPGKLTIDGDVTFQSGATFSVELNGSTAGVTYDQLVMSGAAGTVSLGSSNLLLSLGFAPVDTDFFTVILNDGVNPISGAFSGLSDGSSVYANFGGTTYQGKIYYGANSATSAITGGNDVAITGFAAVPEPSSIVLLGLCLLPGIVVLFRR